MVRRALARQTRWYQNRCSAFKIKNFIVQKPFWKFLEFWPLVTSILTWDKKWPKWFRNDFSRAFERRFLFCSTMRRSRDRRGVFKHWPQVTTSATIWTNGSEPHCKSPKCRSFAREQFVNLCVVDAWRCEAWHIKIHLLCFFYSLWNRLERELCR